MAAYTARFLGSIPASDRIVVKNFRTSQFIGVADPDVYPGSRIRILHPVSRIRIFHPGSRGQKGTGSATLNCHRILLSSLFLPDPDFSHSGSRIRSGVQKALDSVTGSATMVLRMPYEKDTET